MKQTIEYTKTENAYEPERAYPTDAGADLRTIERFVIHEYDTVVVDTGISVAIPWGYFGWIAPKSGLASKGITVDGGIIDSSYRGYINVILKNTTGAPVIFEKGQKIAQLIIIPCMLAKFKEVEKLDFTARGEKGFGSTGK